MRDSWVIVIVAFVALFLILIIVWPHVQTALTGNNDFIAFYSGARLLGKYSLYDNDRLHQISQECTGFYSPEHGYIRLPFHAFFLWPLSQLPYKTAFLLWELASLTALLGFVALWRPPAFSLTLLFSSFSLPAFASLLNGQDDTFLLLFIALSTWLCRHSMQFTAGVVLSLCAIKFHLFAPLPLLIVGQRRWRLGQGILAGGGVLIVICFGTAGWSWPFEFYKSALNPTFSPRLDIMPNLHGLTSYLPWSTTLEILLGTSVVAAVWIVCRNANFLDALAACLTGGLLLNHHAYLTDLSIILPAALTVVSTNRQRLMRFLALLLLAPPIHLAVVSGFPFSAGVVAILLMFVYGMAYQAWRQRKSRVAERLLAGHGPSLHYS